MKVKIVDWHAVTIWHWKLESSDSASGQTNYLDELCGICRVAFDGTCPNCKYPGDECPIVLGDGCPHNFHLHCILRWLEQDSSKGLCPMCRQIFVPKKDKLVNITDEYSNLQTLIDGHRALREGLQSTSDQDFESYRGEDLQMSE